MRQLAVSAATIGFVLALSCSVFAQDAVTVTTYYPAPYGEYRELRLTPTTGTLPGSSCSEAGSLFFDDASQNVYLCKGSPATWQPLGGGITVSPVYSASVSSITSNCGHGCKKTTNMGSEWSFCGLTEYRQKIYDSSQHSHDHNYCYIYKTGSDWILEAYYDWNASDTLRAGYTICQAQCIK